jgi:hypothetical protein
VGDVASWKNRDDGFESERAIINRGRTVAFVETVAGRWDACQVRTVVRLVDLPWSQLLVPGVQQGCRVKSLISGGCPARPFHAKRLQ